MGRCTQDQTSKAQRNGASKSKTQTERGLRDESPQDLVLDASFWLWCLLSSSLIRDRLHRAGEGFAPPDGHL